HRVVVAVREAAVLAADVDGAGGGVHRHGAAAGAAHGEGGGHRVGRPVEHRHGAVDAEEIVAVPVGDVDGGGVGGGVHQHAHAAREVAHGDGGGHRVRRPVEHRQGGVGLVGDVDGAGGGVHRHRAGAGAHGDGGGDRVGGPVEHRHGAAL